MNLPVSYRTRAGLLITLFKEYKDGHLAGYFEIRGVRIRVYYTPTMNEVNGEKGLDLMEKILPEDAYVVKEIFDPKRAREFVLGKAIPKIS